MSFPVWNSDASWNKITSSYFKDTIDLSGNFIIRNGTIRSPNNTIEFDDEFNFINIPNSMNVLTQLKCNYDSIEYDVGERISKIDALEGLAPVVADSQFKTTGLYWDAGLSSTVFTDNVSFPNASISSLAINNTSFVGKSGAETIDGVKTFNNAPVMSGAGITAGSIPIGRVSGTAVNLSSAQTITATKTFSVVQNFSNNIRLDGSLLLSAGTITITNANMQKLSFISTATSDLQTQITNINAVTLADSNVFSGATNQFSNILRLDGSLTLNSNTLTLSNANLQKIQYLSDVSSSVSTSLSNLNTSVSTLNSRTTKMSYMSVGGINTTTILDGLITQTLSFTGTLNNISSTVYGYLSGVTSSIQTQLNNLASSLNPTGSIIMSPLSDIETSSGNKYLLCNGQLVSRTTYATLFGKIGTTFGVGNGSTTFAIMNYQGLFLRCMGSQIINGTTYTGDSISSIQQDAVQNHTHLPQSGSYLVTTSSASATGGYGSQFPATKPDTSNFANTGLMTTGRTNTSENRPVNISVYYYVKT